MSVRTAMPVRANALLLVVGLLLAACGGTTSASQRSSQSRFPQPSATGQATGTTHPGTLATSASSAPDPASPALQAFSPAQAKAALTLGEALARQSVSDPKLLANATRHTDIADFADITKYLTPSAVGYLKRYVRDAYRDAQSRLSVSGLALVAYSKLKPGPGRQQNLVAVPAFDKPFRPSSLTVSVDDTVGLDTSGRMVVTGTAKAVLPAHRGDVPYTTTLGQRFTYNIVALRSGARTVAVDAWYGKASATTERRR